jgi:predicted homoserine dehydrogenase-like protein
VVATAKRDLAAGEILDGEGGATVYGRLMPAAAALEAGGLPLGLAHNVRLKNPVKRGQPVRWTDAGVDESALAVRVRREMERRFAAARQAAE